MVNNIADLKNTKSGRCFIVGNGASLANAPFDKLTDEDTFVVNRIANLFDKTDWRPTYYVHSTVMFGTRYLPVKEIKRVLEVVEKAFIWDRFSGNPYIKQYDNIYFIPISHSGLWQPEDGKSDWWSDDCSKRVCKFGTSIFASMQLAVYMGYQQLYIIGADGYKPFGSHKEDPNHFYSNYHKDCSKSKADYENAMFSAAHKIAQDNCKRLGIEIYDATQSDGLGVLPKVDLLEVLLCE